MDETNMNERTPCVDHEALVTYLYDECAPTERESIATHLAICASCAEEVQALSDTRAHLASWSPPALPLGFQITRTESDQPSRSSKSEGWWRQPLPAWAQVAAAVVIFAAGMSANAFRSYGDQPARVAQAPAIQPVAATAAAQVDDLGVTREEFARLEARLRTMESADVSRASYASRTTDPNDYDEMRAQFSALENRVAASEQLNLKRFGAVSEALRRTNQEVNQRATVMEEGQQELERAVRYTLNPSSLTVRTSLQTNDR
jgi:putative zinc finger protein